MSVTPTVLDLGTKRKLVTWEFSGSDDGVPFDAGAYYLESGMSNMTNSWDIHSSNSPTTPSASSGRVDSKGSGDGTFIQPLIANGMQIHFRWYWPRVLTSAAGPVSLLFREL